MLQFNLDFSLNRASERKLRSVEPASRTSLKAIQSHGDDILTPAPTQFVRVIRFPFVDSPNRIGCDRLSSKKLKSPNAPISCSNMPSSSVNEIEPATVFSGLLGSHHIAEYSIDCMSDYVQTSNVKLPLTLKQHFEEAVWVTPPR